MSSKQVNGSQQQAGKIEESSRLAQFKQNFNIKFQYRNSLPPPPCGPYFMPLEILTSLNQGLPEYRTSSLEKAHVWQPHFGPDLGLKLDLPDMESVLVSDQQHLLDPEDLKYLTATQEKGRGKLKDFDQASKPWWLRNTTYLENNPFNMGKLKDEDLVQKNSEARKRALEAGKDSYDVEAIEESFEVVDKFVESLLAQNPGVTIEWSLPILPYCNSTGEVSSKKRSLVRFDEDPLQVVNAHGVKKFRADHAIITNERQVVKDNGKVQDKLLDVTVIAPHADQEENGVYDWVKDYRMEVKDEDAKDCFLLVQDIGGEGADTVSFVPLVGRIDLHKLPLEKSKPLTATITRDD
ncbi:hypothetical protein EON65_40490 [archaeon]|nr:MAG: hypothetical protein EON65_40490 [archaeon]